MKKNVVLLKKTLLIFLLALNINVVKTQSTTNFKTIENQLQGIQKNLKKLDLNLFKNKILNTEKILKNINIENKNNKNENKLKIFQKIMTEFLYIDSSIITGGLTYLIIFMICELAKPFWASDLEYDHPIIAGLVVISTMVATYVSLKMVSRKIGLKNDIKIDDNKPISIENADKIDLEKLDLNQLKEKLTSIKNILENIEINPNTGIKINNKKALALEKLMNEMLYLNSTIMIAFAAFFIIIYLGTTELLSEESFVDKLRTKLADHLPISILATMVISYVSIKLISNKILSYTKDTTKINDKEIEETIAQISQTINEIEKQQKILPQNITFFNFFK